LRPDFKSKSTEEKSSRLELGSSVTGTNAESIRKGSLRKASSKGKKSKRHREATRHLGPREWAPLARGPTS